MATTTGRALCSICNKEKVTFPCRGCNKEFCLTHLQEHHQMFQGQLDEIINDYNQFKQTITEQKRNPSNSILLKQIDQWEQTSIEKIRKTAQECREIVINQTRRAVDVIEEKVGQFSSELKLFQKENQFNEIDLRRLTDELTQMTRELIKPSNISIQPNSQTLIHKIHISLSTPEQRQESKYQRWKQDATTVAGGNGEGPQLNQLSRPFGICVDRNNNVLIADYDNHRIVRWEWYMNKGTVVAGGNGQGSRRDQLSEPIDVIVDKQHHSIIIADRGNRRVIRWFDENQSNQDILIDYIDCSRLAMDKEGFLYVSDDRNHEVRRWKVGERQRTIVAGRNGKGSEFSQLNVPSYLFVDDEQSVYVSDFGNHRVMKWPKDAKEGIIVAGGNEEGSGLNQLSYPQGVIVDRWGQIYVADCENHRVMRWQEGKKKERSSSVEMEVEKVQINCRFPVVYRLMKKEIFMLLIVTITEFRSLI